VAALLLRADNDEPLLSAYAVRHMLSALLEGLNNDSSWLEADAIETIFAALKL
jgi:hypothetical protein